MSRTADQTLWIGGRKALPPLKRGHLYLGIQGTFLLWVDRGQFHNFFTIRFQILRLSRTGRQPG